ncbi:MAG: hypothetical protein JSR57_01480 [Verrucomicrobia bacterium]|nr:hypothetical protein [Verrucomicrobiota bacterium]
MSVAEISVKFTESLTLSDQAVKPVSALNSVLKETVRKIEGRVTEKNAENPHFFQFPEDSRITLRKGQVVDISQIEIDLSDIFIGGINYGGGGGKLIGGAMEAVGSCHPVCNLPVMYDGVIYSDFRAMEMVSKEDKVISPDVVSTMIATYLGEGYTHFNIPITLNNHASLLSIIVLEDKATFRFYDSLSPEVISYEERYCPALLEYLTSLLPPGVQAEFKGKPDVLHLFDQGDATSKGCGYYSVYTAALLKECPELRDLTSFEEPPLLTQAHDKGIRAELAVRTLLEFGLERVDLSFTAMISQKRDGIFSRIQNVLPNLIEQLKPRVSVFQ